MFNKYSKITPQSNLDNPVDVQLESRKLFMSFIRRPFSGQSIFSSL